MEVSYNELRCKEVINLVNGKRLGHICDIILSSTSKTVLGLVVPSQRRLFQAREDIFIPWKNIQKIGDDVILVCIEIDSCTNIMKKPNPAEFEHGDFIVN